jgi:hypothetical protein
VALEGNLQDFSLSDMLRLLESGAKTGTLELERSDERGIVCMREGRVCFAAGPRYGHPLGKRLVSDGIISENQLRQALGLQKIQTQEKSGRRLAQVLIEEGFVDARTLDLFVREALYEALFDLFLWDSGTVRFEQGDSCAEYEIGILVQVEAVLQEMTKRLDEWQRIRERIPSLDTVFITAPGPGEKSADIHLSPAEWMVLAELHGGRTVRELMAATGASDFEMTRTLYSMQMAGLVDMAGSVG